MKSMESFLERWGSGALERVSYVKDPKQKVTKSKEKRSGESSQLWLWETPQGSAVRAWGQDLRVIDSPCLAS